MKERDIEHRLMAGVKKLGGVAYKFTAPGRRSVPDRLCVLPFGLICFVECKRPGGHVTHLQVREIAKLREFGHWVCVADSFESTDSILTEMKALIDKKN